jgi:hypothetical protein
MLSFAFQKSRTQVRRLLQNRMNRNYFKQFRYGQRTDPRSNFCEVVWIIPYGNSGKPEFDRVFPVVTKDSSSEGLSLIHTQPFSADKVLVGLPGVDDGGPTFVRCVPSHSTSLGYGFWQVGLRPERVVELGPVEQAQLKRELGRFEANEPALEAADA